MNLTRKTYATRSEKVIDFVIGFVGFFVLNGVIGGGAQLVIILLNNASIAVNDSTIQSMVGVIGLALGCLPFILNIGLIIFFAFTRYWIALGALGALAVSLIIAICIAIIIGGACFALLGGINGSAGP